MKEIRLSGLAFKNFLRGLAELGYEAPTWTYSDPDDSYCDVKSESGRDVRESDVEALDDCEVVVLDGFITLGHCVTSLSLQNTYRRWTKGLLPPNQKPSQDAALAIDRLVAGLVLLKGHHPDLVPVPFPKEGRILMVRDARLASIRDADSLRLKELGWWTDDGLAWTF